MIHDTSTKVRYLDTVLSAPQATSANVWYLEYIWGHFLHAMTGSKASARRQKGLSIDLKR